MNLFQKAGKGLTLSPAQRAVLKLVEGFAIAGFVAALPVVAQLLGHQNISWQVVAQAAAGAFATAVLLAIAKYYRAQGDAPLADAAEAAAAAVPQPKLPKLALPAYPAS